MDANASPKDLRSQIQPPGLYIVATPIGNLQDITLRAIELLKNVDVILCEDTRVSAKLLSHYGISSKTQSYNEHNAAEQRPSLLKRLQNGEKIALISDAGTPLISDPGFKLVREVIEAGIYVTTLPGASSIMAALCLSGLPTDRFFMQGFLPPKSEARQKAIAELAAIPSSLIMLESPKRLKDCLQDLAMILGARQTAIARELTKLFEEIRRGTLPELAAHYGQAESPKGEIVIVVGPPLAEAAPVDLTGALQLLLASHSVKEAAQILAEQTGRPRKEIYALALQLKP